MNQTVKGVDPNGTIPDPTKDLIVVVEASEGFQGGRSSFDMPFEPIASYVVQVVMWNSEIDTVLHESGQDAPFDIVDWNPGTRELRVRLHKGAFGT
jgi:hypothetical protein